MLLLDQDSYAAFVPAADQLVTDFSQVQLQRVNHAHTVTPQQIHRAVVHAPEAHPLRLIPVYCLFVYLFRVFARCCQVPQASWRALQIFDSDATESGVLASLSKPLVSHASHNCWIRRCLFSLHVALQAALGIAVLNLSSFNTDYICVPSERLEEAIVVRSLWPYSQYTTVHQYVHTRCYQNECIVAVSAT